MPPPSASRPPRPLAAATQLYLRYDGEIGSGTDNHALNVNVGVRFT
jgi:hypothetical protein